MNAKPVKNERELTSHLKTVSPITTSSSFGSMVLQPTMASDQRPQGFPCLVPHLYLQGAFCCTPALAPSARRDVGQSVGSDIASIKFAFCGIIFAFIHLLMTPSIAVKQCFVFSKALHYQPPYSCADLFRRAGKHLFYISLVFSAIQLPQPSILFPDHVRRERHDNHTLLRHHHTLGHDCWSALQGLFMLRMLPHTASGIPK